MTSILLGPLANTYNSNLSDKINQIEINQTTQLRSNPDFLKQFDELTFDNVNDPVGANESHTGINTSLQRNLDFINGYSNFQKNNMHYDVVSKNDFSHNNMVPFTSKRDFSLSADRSQRKLETFTGIDPFYVLKKEKVPLFQPLPSLTWVNGMPVVADKLTSRYLPSNKNNYGNLPFENNVKVRPGIEFTNQEGNYAVYRVNPRNVDALRSEINQKITYENKPLETIKKGDIRAPDPTLSKFKLPDHRVLQVTDLVPNKFSVEKPKQTGVFTNVFSQRNETDT